MRKSQKLIPITLLVYYNKVSSYHKQGRQLSIHELRAGEAPQGLVACKEGGLDRVNQSRLARRE